MVKNLSVPGAHSLKSEEGLRLKKYLCAAGVPTIGYGHALRPGDPESITQQQADAFFESDVAWAVEELNKTPGANLTQAQFDALVSFIFNIGAGAWRGSTARRDLIQGKIELIPAEIQRWCHDYHGNVILGLKKRRIREADMFLEGKYA